MEESVLFLCTGGTIDKCYPRTQVDLNDDDNDDHDDHEEDEDDHDDDDHHDIDTESISYQGGYSFEFGDPAVEEVFPLLITFIIINDHHHIHR